MDKLREEFEVWYSEKFKYSDKKLVRHGETYLSPFAGGLWSAWKESRDCIVVHLPDHITGEETEYMLGVLDELDKIGVKYE